MMEKEPLSFPSRNTIPFNPAIADRQLWAIGMIVVQWSMLEWFLDVECRKHIADDKALLDEYNGIRNFTQFLAFWKNQTETKVAEPLRSQLVALIPHIKNLSSQRDDIVHRLWAGGIEGSSWAASGEATADGAIMPTPGQPLKTKASSGPLPPKWRATFGRLRQLARDVGKLNQYLLSLTVLGPPPHGDINAGREVTV